MHTDVIVMPLELKFAGSPDAGEFEGYGAVFGNTDLHGDRILPGAFAGSLAEIKTGGRSIPMHVNHGLSVLGGQRGIGVWQDMAEDAKGLRMKGKISGMNTDAGRHLFERVKDGAFPGLSIGYKVAPNGASYGQRAGEPRRTLKAVHLHEVSLVDSPANGSALIDGFKAALFQADPGSAAASIASAMRLHDGLMTGGDYGYGPRGKSSAQIMNHMRDAHEALTGERAPIDLASWKAAPTIRDVERLLREEFDLSHAEARAVAERRFKTAPRDEGSRTAPDDAAALHDAVAGFALPSFT